MASAERQIGGAAAGAVVLGAVELDEIGPERIFHYYDPPSGLRAIVVIDTTRFGISGGGVRMAADLSVAEMVRLARAMSYKFAILDLPCGGAKAGIWLDPSAAERPRVMRAFLEAVRPLVEARAYMPGADMGTAAADFSPFYTGAANLAAQEFDGMLLEDQLTGYGVVMAARAGREWMGMSLQGARVALEGFGKVGAGAAKYFDREGARLVAVSTIRGTLSRPEGIDISRLLALRGKHGDAALDEYAEGRELLPPAALYEVAADVLVPGARPDAIHESNAARIKASLVVPAANIPYAPGVPAKLHARRVVALPDFVTNAGGVIAGLVGLQQGTAPEAFAMARERIPANVRACLEAGRDRDCSAYDAALAAARERLAEGPRAQD